MIAGAGLCESCEWAHTVRSGRGAVFLLCGRFADDARFPKYPRLPVVSCIGYERREAVADVPDCATNADGEGGRT